MMKERIWTKFLLALLFPIVGGLIVYFWKRKRDKHLANACLLPSVLHPYIVSIVLSVLFGAIGWIFSIVFLLALNWYFISSTKNNYRKFLPAFYFGLLGVIYSYYFGYKKNKFLRKQVSLFFLSEIVLGIAVVIISVVSVVSLMA